MTSELHIVLLKRGCVGKGYPPNRGWGGVGGDTADHTNSGGQGWGRGRGVGIPLSARPSQCTGGCARPKADPEEGAITRPLSAVCLCLWGRGMHTAPQP